MALRDLLSNMITAEGGRSVEDDMPMLEQGLDKALDRKEKGKSIGYEIDNLINELSLLFQGAGIKVNISNLINSLHKNNKLNKDKINLLEEGLNRWIIRNNTRLEALNTLQ